MKKTSKKKKNKVVAKPTIKQEVKVVDVKEEKDVKKPKKKYYADALIILAIMIVSICLHIPSYKYTMSLPMLFDEFRDENGDTYLHDMDSYFYSRKVREFADTGIDLQATRSDDKLRGPISEKDNAIDSFAFPAFVSIIWRIVRLFSKNIPFIRFIRFMGPIISSLACIPAYLFVKKRTNWLGGLTAGFIAATCPAFFGQTGFGCFDTDLVLYVLPLTFMCCFIEAIQEKDSKKQLIWTIASCLAYLVLTYTWVSHTIYFYLAVGLSCVFVFFTLIREKFNFKKSFEYKEFKPAVIFIVVLTAITLLVDKAIDVSVFGNLLNILKGKDVFSIGVYPDPGKYVSELTSIPWLAGGIKSALDGGQRGIINRMGGLFQVLLALATLIYLFSKGIKYFRRNTDENRNYYILGVVLILWIICGLLCLKGGSRFTKIPAIPMSLTTGIGMGLLYKHAKNKEVTYSAIFITIAFILFIPSLAALDQAKNQNPSANDGLTDISDWVKDNAKDDAIIISWWDYGYYYQFRSGKTAAADGGVFNGRYYYWLANIFISNDEHLSSAISKMIAYSGTEASYLADEYMGSPKKGCEMLKEILVLEKNEAARVLKDKYKLSNEQINKLLKYSHADEGRDIIIVVTKDMLTKIKPISYYAKFDFTDNNNGVSTVDSEFMMYRFYHNYDIEGYYEYLTNIPDKTTSHNGQLWRLVK